MEKFDLCELAWSAGFFDGEGYIKCHHYQYGDLLGIAVDQVDRQVLDRLSSALKVGKVFGPYKQNNPKHAARFSFRVHGHEQVQYIVACLWKWLSPVKRAQAAKALKDYLLYNSQRRYAIIPTELRIQVRNLRLQGLKYKQISNKLSISQGTVCKIIKYRY